MWRTETGQFFRRLRVADRGDPWGGHVERLSAARGAVAASLLHVARYLVGHTGTIYTTNRRVWEYDTSFKEYLVRTHATGIDMETATLLTAGFANQIPTGALLMVSDKPLEENGVKTQESDKGVTQKFAPEHVELGIAALEMIIDEKKTIQHIKFNW